MRDVRTSAARSRRAGPAPRRGRWRAAAATRPNCHTGLVESAMVVFSNRRLGPSAELFVSIEVASTLLRETAAAARPVAEARWEVELVLWLDSRADAGSQVLDVADIAWTPEHF